MYRDEGTHMLDHFILLSELTLLCVISKSCSENISLNVKLDDGFSSHLDNYFQFYSSVINCRLYYSIILDWGRYFEVAELNLVKFQK